MKFIYKNLIAAAVIFATIFFISISISSFATYIVKAQICSSGEFAAHCDFEEISLFGLFWIILLGIPIYILVTVFWLNKDALTKNPSERKSIIIQIGSVIGLILGTAALIIALLFLLYTIYIYWH